MGQTPTFVEAYLTKGRSLFQAGCVQEPLFSRGTYQIGVLEKGKKEEFPFIQMREDGEVIDSFCTCKISEKGNGCPHLAAAYLQIFNGFAEPLHVRFKNSFWNKFLSLASQNFGHESRCFQKTAESQWAIFSPEKKPLLSIRARTAGAKKRLEEILSKRAVETEETSMKFSNLSAEELAQYRVGQASPSLRYELSFWADLAKWFMNLQEKKKPYKIVFTGSPLPDAISIDFSLLSVHCHLPESFWPEIIPSLNTIHSPLRVFDAKTTIEAAAYDEVQRTVLIHRKKPSSSQKASDEGFPIGDWIYVANEGFYHRREKPLPEQSRISEEEIASFLSESHKEISRFLAMDATARKACYELSLDSQRSLHIRLYVLRPGDMQSDRAACFAPWAYVPGHGFFLLEDWFFYGKEQVIPAHEVADFVNRHRLWLHQFPGFQTHLGSLESHLTFEVTAEEELVFHAELDFPEEEAVNFDEWIYLRGQGFYMKRESRGRLPLHPGLKIPKEEIGPFIAEHKEDLEQVHDFFLPDPPVKQLGLHISLNEEGLIAISPKTILAEGIDPARIQLFGDFFYLRERGFFEIPPRMRLPDRYRHPVVISSTQEASFIAYDFEPLKPYILELDPRLATPQTLHLKIRRMHRERRSKVRKWWVDLVYASEMGVVDLFAIWDALQRKRRYLFSPAGLILLKDPRYHWIRQLQKQQLDRERRWVRLSTLEWIRLSVFEEIAPPKGDSPEEAATRKLFEEMGQLETSRLLDISQLKATLRPYQEQGVHWLWFLYCHGLSGLLCDDMGLGKTHQAMALLAAVSHEREGSKYLVVCPTSVIYHWQDLLQRFLPHLKVCSYHGLERSLEDFDVRDDLLLTSYGILRTGRESLNRFRFEVAIFDEIQIAKNQASQTHRALRKIHAEMRLGLTGTPIENRLKELKALFDLILPSYLPPDAVFRELFVNPIEKLGDEGKKALLGKLVKPLVLRRKKTEVLRDLPEKIEEIAYCDLSEEQRALYREAAEKVRGTFYQELRDESKPVSYVHIFSILSTLKRVCDHPALYWGNPREYRSHASGKWDLFVELLSEAQDSGQKVVVFSQYLEMIAIIEMHLKRRGIGYASIKGATRDRREQLRRFREDPDCQVFVASLLAAGVGIDLTVASIVIHYDRWWNPAKENQATDRVHRIGQNRGVQVFKLVAKDTIEEHIHEMIERKKGLLEQIIGAEDQIHYLNRKELLEVFERMFQEGGR